MGRHGRPAPYVSQGFTGARQPLNMANEVRPAGGTFECSRRMSSTGAGGLPVLKACVCYFHTEE